MLLSEKIAVTGMGLISPLGKSVGETWQGVLAGECGISRHDERTQCPDRLKYFGKVDGFERMENIPSNLASQTRFLVRGSIIGFEAAREAITHSRLAEAAISKERRALFIAAGDLTVIGYDYLHAAIREERKSGNDTIDLRVLNRAMLHRTHPFYLLESIANNPFSFFSAVFEFMGANTTLALHSPCGTNALELACRSIRTGEADAALAVGCGNWITEIPMIEMDGLKLLSRCGQGASSFKPFDRGRDGFIPSEGGAAIVLENAEAATRRGAQIYAFLSGFGNCTEFPSTGESSFPNLITKRSIESALDEGPFDPRDLAFICAHGNATQDGDRSELESMAEVLGKSRSEVPICALKPCTGHMGSASDVAEVILGIKALSEGTLPGTLNFSKADPEFQDLKISASIQPVHGRGFLSTSYGMMGQSASVLIEAVRAV